MVETNHYDTLNLDPTATQAQIKQAYRRLVKQFHPDTQRETANSEFMIRLNAAYEVLGDPQRRQSYDRQRQRQTVSSGTSRKRANVGRQYRQSRQRARDCDEQIQLWLYFVYTPVSREVQWILSSLDNEIDDLSADPFDDELLENFCTYLNGCRDSLSRAQHSFRSMPNPGTMAGVAADLYHCLNQIGDGIEELEFFTFNYDDRHLHTGTELFRIAAGLRWDAQEAMRNRF